MAETMGVYKFSALPEHQQVIVLEYLHGAFVATQRGYSEMHIWNDAIRLAEKRRKSLYPPEAEVIPIAKTLRHQRQRFVEGEIAKSWDRYRKKLPKKNIIVPVRLFSQMVPREIAPR